MSTIAEHRLRPELTLNEHVRRSQISLGKALSERRAIYLDTRFWIILRSAAVQAQFSVGADELLETLRDGVVAGQLFCPISESIFLELVNQSDTRSRNATVALIDELSLGATLVESQTRIRTEIAHFMRSKLESAEQPQLKYLVWCKLGYVLGFLHPAETGFDAATELAIQKAFFDRMWTISLTEMNVAASSNSVPEEVDFAKTASKLNDEVAAHASELRSFEQAYSAEVRGIAELTASDAVEFLDATARHAGRTAEGESTADRQEIERQCRNLLSIALERNIARDSLRTMHILASLHASLRWNKGQKFKRNDFMDFGHAAAAIAYCDAFFTEGPLHAMVTQKHLALDKLYNCRVVSKIEEAISYLRQESAGWALD